MSLVIHLHPDDCIPPHGLELADPNSRDSLKVAYLQAAFERCGGFNRAYPALIGYPSGGKVQLLSGTHRHEAARRSNTLLPVTLWLHSDIVRAWGRDDLTRWNRVMEDVPVMELEGWNRERVSRDAENLTTRELFMMMLKEIPDERR